MLLAVSPKLTLELAVSVVFNLRFSFSVYIHRRRHHHNRLKFCFLQQTYKIYFRAASSYFSLFLFIFCIYISVYVCMFVSSFQRDCCRIRMQKKFCLYLYIIYINRLFVCMRVFLLFMFIISYAVVAGCR